MRGEHEVSNDADSKSPNRIGCPSPFNKDRLDSQNRRLKKYENDDIPQEKVVRIYQEELAKLMGRRVEDLRGPREFSSRWGPNKWKRIAIACWIDWKIRKLEIDIDIRFEILYFYEHNWRDLREDIVSFIEYHKKNFNLDIWHSFSWSYTFWTFLIRNTISLFINPILSREIHIRYSMNMFLRRNSINKIYKQN